MTRHEAAAALAAKPEYTSTQRERTLCVFFSAARAAEAFAAARAAGLRVRELETPRHGNSSFILLSK